MKISYYLLVIALILLSCSLFAQSSDSTLSSYHIRNRDLTRVAITNDLDKTAISLLGGSYTGLLNRIAGVTFVRGSLVSFRGLNPRYTNITLDGLAAPITEQTIKAFALGLLPPTALQGMYINKSGDYHNQGEWGGAVLNISTNSNLKKNFMKVVFGIGYQHNFTFEDYITDQDHETQFGDVLGYGVGRRDITKDIVSREELQQMNRNQAAEEGQKLRNVWGLRTKSALPTFNLAFNVGRIIFDKGDSKLSTINSISYSRKQGGTHFLRARYTGYEFNEQGEAIGSDLDSYSTDGVFVTNAALNINSGWNYIINKDHSLNLDLSYAHTGNFQTTSKYFIGLNNNKEVYFARYSLLAKGVFQARLLGNNQLTDRLKLSWTLGYGISNRNEPDQRNSAAQRNLDAPEDPFLLVIPESSKADTGARFNSDMDDDAYSGRFDLDYAIVDQSFHVKAGFLTELNDRRFRARLLTNVKDDFTSPELRFVPMQELDVVFEPENFGPEGYFLNDATTDFDIYDADNQLYSGYVGVDNRFGSQWRTSLGLRVENFTQRLETGDIKVDNQSTDYLPFINVSWQTDPNTVLKLSYSHSVNRPAFRELSPFIFYDFDFRADIQGNPDLLNASLRNLDFSLLHTFGKNEYFSITPFYKRINNPIEMIYIIRSDRPLFTFDNAEQAELGGVEIEFSKFLSNRDGTILRNLLFLGSFSYTQSVIQLGENTNEVATSRPLQGQIPLIFTAGLTYIAPDKRSQVTLSYKYVGQSLFSVGDGQNTFPWYNAPVNLLNGGFSYEFKSGLDIKVAAINLLNTRFSQIEDTNFNGKITDEVDKEVQRGLSYQSYNLTIGYKF